MATYLSTKNVKHAAFLGPQHAAGSQRLICLSLHAVPAAASDHSARSCTWHCCDGSEGLTCIFIHVRTQQTRKDRLRLLCVQVAALEQALADTKEGMDVEMRERAAEADALKAQVGTRCRRLQRLTAAILTAHLRMQGLSGYTNTKAEPDDFL